MSFGIRIPGVRIPSLGIRTDEIKVPGSDVVKWAVNPAGQFGASVAGAATKRDMSGIMNPVGAALGNAADPKQESPYTAQLIGGGAAAREADMAAGRKRGQEIFYDDEAKGLANRYADLAKGYSGAELGALRGSAQQENARNQNAYSRQLASNAARAGVGGARRAAMLQAGNEGFNRNTAAFERGLTADNAALIRSGLDKEADFRGGQKYGVLGTELGYAQLGVSDRTQQNAAAQNQQQKRGLLGDLLSGLGL